MIAASTRHSCRTMFLLLGSKDGAGWVVVPPSGGVGVPRLKAELRTVRVYSARSASGTVRRRRRCQRRRREDDTSCVVNEALRIRPAFFHVVVGHQIAVRIEPARIERDE